MYLVTRAFNSAIQGYEDKFPEPKRVWYEQLLRLIALIHDIGHAPFSHASEKLFSDGMEHEDYTVKIINETEIADIIYEIGKEFVNKYGEEYNITPELLCDIYMGRDAGPNSEFMFLKSFMDSELDCDKMDYVANNLVYGTISKEKIINKFKEIKGTKFDEVTIENTFDELIKLNLITV